MQEQKATKVTLYLPPDLHRQLKIRSAVDGEAMSAIAQRAIDFYLTHSDVVESEGVHGQTHRVYSCPSCSTSVVLKDGDLTKLSKAAAIDESSDLGVHEMIPDTRQPEEGELVVC